MQHYTMAKSDLDHRISDWNTKDELFRSHINEADWPYSAQVFDPRTFTAIFEKSARLLANKPRGKMIPREGGDVLGAKINNQLLAFQWDEAERVDGTPMLAKWAMMDMNARKYGASFAVAKWRFEERGEGKKKHVWFDGPTLNPWNNRDVLHNPSYSYIKNWIQLREYVVLDELKRANDAAREAPIYKNLHILRESVGKKEKGGGDTRSVNWASRNLSIKGLEDFLGRDPVYKTVEVITEYRPDRWITFAPKHGVILRDIPNPYDHGRIPVTMLKYYPIDEDIYGLSEIEPVEKIQKAINALVCQYLDSINMNLYPIVKVRTAAVQMHTLEFGPGKKWLMNDPQTDVLPYQQSDAGIAEFTSTYRFLVGAMQEALGETSAAMSQMVPGGTEKTATEIKETSLQRNVRDNFNQLFLSEALKDQMMLWHLMDKQFLFNDPNETSKVIRIVGRDAIRFFEERDLTGMAVPQEMMEHLETEDNVEGMNAQIENSLEPISPVETEGGLVPKVKVDESGEVAELFIEPEDLSGNYDYIPEIRSMQVPDANTVQVLQQMIMEAKDPAAIQARMMDGQRLKLADLEKEFFELLGMKDAERFYEKAEGGANAENLEAFLARQGGTEGGPTPAQPGKQPGVAGGAKAMAGGKARPVVS